MLGISNFFNIKYKNEQIILQLPSSLHGSILIDYYASLFLSKINMIFLQKIKPIKIEIFTDSIEMKKHKKRLIEKKLWGWTSQRAGGYNNIKNEQVHFNFDFSFIVTAQKGLRVIRQINFERISRFYKFYVDKISAVSRDLLVQPSGSKNKAILSPVEKASVWDSRDWQALAWAK